MTETSTATRINTDAIRINHDQTIKTGAGEFYANQRNEGYADNDGRWVVHQQPELYWSTAGVLRQRRPGAFLGIFDTTTQAEAAISAATQQPINDHMVR